MEISNRKERNTWQNISSFLIHRQNDSYFYPKIDLKSPNRKIIADKASTIVIIVNIGSENRIVGYKVKFDFKNVRNKMILRKRTCKMFRGDITGFQGEIKNRFQTFRKAKIT